MKTLISLLCLLLSSLLNPAHSQNNLWANLYSGDTVQLYRGVVNKIGISVTDLKNPCNRAKIIIYASGTDMKVAGHKDKPSVFSVLPLKDICFLNVYVEYNKELYKAGTVVFKTRPIPNPNTEHFVVFKADVPVIKRTLMDESFNTQGKTLKTGRFEASQMNSFIYDFSPGKANLVSISLVDTVKKCENLSEVILESDDAEIKKINRKIFSVTPKEEVKRCTIRIYGMINNKKTLLKEEWLKVF